MKKLLALVAFLACFSFANAIKTHAEGDLSVLKGAGSVNTKFTYENMLVGSMTEAAYLEKKVSEYNQKKAGRGDEFAKAWESNKQNSYPNNFKELFEKNTDLKCNDLQPQKYTIIVNTTFFEPGFNVGVMRKNAEISVVVRIVETENPDKVLGEITVTNSPGRTVSGYDYDVASRVNEAYAKAGKEAGKLIKKACK